MKKLFLSFVLCTLSLGTLMATDLWTGSQHVSWDDGGLQIAAAQFAAAMPGQKIVLHYSDATDGLELKVINANFDHLAGSRESAWISGNSTYEQFLTQAAVDSLKLYGLELIGANFTATKVELLDGKELKEGLTVWTGFFWVNDEGGWKTLELYSDGYAGVDFSQVSAIRFYSEAANGEYIINFMEAWGDEGKIADQNAMTDGEGYKELALTDELRTRVANASHWMIQFSHQSLSPFNFTDVVLVPTGETAITNTAVDSKAVKIIENGQIFILKNGIRYNALGVEIK